MSSRASNFEPLCVAVLGLGEAGSALARGLCATDGWRSVSAQRQVIAVDIAFGKGPRGEAMAAMTRELEMPAEAEFTSALSSADMVISVVTGDDAAVAARMVRPLLRPGTIYADFNSITGPQTKAVAAEFAGTGIDFVDVAVMGSFMASGHCVPLLLAGPRASDLRNFTESFGAPSRVLNHSVGDASAVKILRSILMKGIESLSIECLVAARRQGLVEQVLDNVSDVDSLGFAKFLEMLTTTHLVHAKRRMEEMDKAIQNLDETGVPALMSQSTRRSLQRTVDASLEPSQIAGLDLNSALKVLDESVIGR